MKPVNTNNIIGADGGSYRDLPAGVYTCRIKKVVDFPNNESLSLVLDIEGGEYDGFFAGDDRDWAHNVFVSYGETDNFGGDNLPKLAYILESITDLNPGFDAKAAIAAGKEQMLVGRACVAVFRLEEYFSTKNDSFMVGNSARPFKLIKAEDMDKYREPKVKMLTDNAKKKALKRAGYSDLGAEEFLKRASGATPATSTVAVAAEPIDLPF